MNSFEDALFCIMKSFPGSYLNCHGDLIVHEKGNQWFNFMSCKTIEDVQWKVLAFLSRGAYKSIPFKSQKRNEQMHRAMLDGINNFLMTNFDEDDIARIYIAFGNGCNEQECREFIRRGFKWLGEEE